MPPGPTDRDADAATRRADAVRARFAPPPSRLAARVVAVAPFAIPAFFLGWFAISAILAKLGHPGAALDDSFIHFQYARAIAEGHPFRYEAGEPATMGATSALWPLVLAPFYAVGFTGLSLLWPAWILSFVALGLLACEVCLLTKPLAGTAAALGAGAMVLAFSPFTWCAGSGMEVVPFAYCLARVARRASEFWESERPSPRLAYELVALAFVAPLFRPEGALASLVVVAALATARHGASVRARFLAPLGLLGAVTPQLLSVVVTGAIRSNTAEVKLLPGNPYYVGPALTAVLRENVHTLIHVLLDGDIWSAEFLPHGSMPFAFAGLGAIVVCARARGRQAWFRALVVLALAAAIAVPCAYVSFLWNRLRYLWPFAAFWLVGIACFTRVLGDALGRVRPRWRLATPIAAGVVVGLFAAKLEGTIQDLANSASGIDRQQVALGKWAKTAIPEGARVGVSDTGAIAYFGDHPTFDVIGLTTRAEGRYWVAGAASRFEHYEHLYAANPASLPTYFILYPEWMAMNEILGARLHDATVTDSTILGGQTMVAYEADYSRLGSGERPWTHDAPVDAEFVDALDVADLDSEKAHAYALLGAPDGEEVLTMASTPDDKEIVDGGRRGRWREKFRVHLGGADAKGIARLSASETMRVHVLADGKDVASFVVEDAGWVETTFTVPAASDETVVEFVPDSGTLTTYHYWFYR